MSNIDHAEGFDWDDDAVDSSNTAHLMRRNITSREAEEAWANGGVLARNKRGRTGDRLFVGLTLGGRALTLVLSYIEDRRLIRVITGWDSTAGERARYLGRRERR